MEFDVYNYTVKELEKMWLKKHNQLIKAFNDFKRGLDDDCSAVPVDSPKSPITPSNHQSFA